VKKYVLIALGLLLVGSTAFAALGDLVATYPLPVANPRGVAKSNAYIHYVAYSNPNVVVTLTNDGSFVRSWPCPTSLYNRGLSYSWGGNIWVGNYGTDMVYRCDYYDGSVYYSWNAGHDPYGVATYCTGDGGAGLANILTYDSSPNLLYYHVWTNGAVVHSTPLAYPSSYDIAYDWRNRLVWKKISFGELVTGMYYYDGNVIASFHSPVSGTAYGMAYSATYLYIAYYNCIAKVHCPDLGLDDTNIAPASMGGIKAMYR
jgi:hypothetical protein